LIYAGTGNNYAGVRNSPTTATSDAMIAFDATDGHIVWVNQRTTGDDWNPPV
jgi:glucose dehydrogenase